MLCCILIRQNCKSFSEWACTVCERCWARYDVSAHWSVLQVSATGFRVMVSNSLPYLICAWCHSPWKRRNSRKTWLELWLYIFQLQLKSLLTTFARLHTRTHTSISENAMCGTVASVHVFDLEGWRTSCWCHTTDRHQLIMWPKQSQSLSPPYPVPLYLLPPLLSVSLLFSRRWREDLLNAHCLIR